MIMISTITYHSEVWSTENPTKKKIKCNYPQSCERIVVHLQQIPDTRRAEDIDTLEDIAHKRRVNTLDKIKAHKNAITRKFITTTKK